MHFVNMIHIQFSKAFGVLSHCIMCQMKLGISFISSDRCSITYP